jgi:hypothetical protein
LAGESGYNSYGNKTGGRKEGSIIFFKTLISNLLIKCDSTVSNL